MSNWESLEIEAKVRELLESFQYDPRHHFGRPYVSSYQLAIAFAREYPAAAASLGYAVGGAGTGEYNSIAKYLAHELSTRIKKKTITDIDGAWLSRQSLPEIDFIDDEDESTRKASMNPKGLSVFRLVENAPE